MDDKFKFNSRGKRSDSLGSLDDETLEADHGAEHGWKKNKATTRARTYARSEVRTLTPQEDSGPLNGKKSDVETLADSHLLSDDESDIVYEADITEKSDCWAGQNDGCDDGLSIEGNNGLSRESATSTEMSDSNQCSWSGRIAGKNCVLAPTKDLDESSEDGSIQYEADLNKSTSQEQVDTQYEDDRLLCQSTDRSAPPPLLPSLYLTKSESFSSDDDFNVEDALYPLLKGNHAQCMARNFAMEHRIFIKCLMSLLEQRDLVAIDMDDPNTIKCGPLRKATQLVKGAWKVKYVEIRRGIFSYYDDCLSKDAASEGSLVRKNVRLHANSCICRAVKLNHKSLTIVPGQAIFELTVEGSPRRFWMANSREERSAWISAIHDAMVGGAITRDEQQMDHAGRVGRVSRRSPYKHDLETYLKVQRDIKNAPNKLSYVGALANIVGQTLNVPVRWISEQSNLNTEETEKAFREDGITTGVNQLWKDLARDTVQINEELIKGGSGHAPERIVGAVSREILRIDRSSPLRPKDASFVWKGVTELQALSFARDILLSCNRTRSGGDSYYCVDALTTHPGMVVLVPSSMEAEPLSIEIKHYEQTHRMSKASYSVHDRGGWLKTRTRYEPDWKLLFFVLSEGTLSIYRKGNPRPYGLEAQIKVADAPMFVAPAISHRVIPFDDEDGDRKRCFVLTMKGREGIVERQILFDAEDKFLIWAHALQEEISKNEGMESPRRNVKFFQMLIPRDESKGDDRIGFVLGVNSLEDNAEELGFDPALITSRAKALALQYGGCTKVPTVTVQVKASSTYKICTLDPQGDEYEDTWATVRATFLQDFSIAGGPNGLMNRSEEVVQIIVLDCSLSALAMHSPAPDVSPRSLAGSISRKLRRKDVQNLRDSTPPQNRSNGLRLRLVDS